MLASGNFSDLKIVSGDGQEFAVHKAVLCPQSSFFNSACTVDMKVSCAPWCTDKAHGTLGIVADDVMVIRDTNLTLVQEKAENLITLPESSDVVKALLNFCYAPFPRGRDDYFDPDEDRCGPTYLLAQHAALYVAADKYIFPEFKRYEESLLDEFIGDTNTNLIYGLGSSLDGQDVNEAPATWHMMFLDLVKAVEFLLEHTRDDDPIRTRLLDIIWTRFAHGKNRESWVALIEKHPGYAAELMVRQSQDDWVLIQARRIENEKRAAASRKAATFV